MKHLKQIAAALSVLLIMSVSLYAGDVKQDTKKETPKELKNQTLCPVMGGKIDSTSYTDIQGQRVYQCCPMCSKSLKADPDKYFKKAAEEGVLFENIQTTCPVSGVELEEKTIFTDSEGRRIYFCCNKCRGTFGDDPGKYLSTMDAPVKDNKKDDKHQSHEGNGH